MPLPHRLGEMAPLPPRITLNPTSSPEAGWWSRRRRDPRQLQRKAHELNSKSSRESVGEGQLSAP